MAIHSSPHSPQYLLLFRESSPENYRAMSPEQRQHLLSLWNLWFERLAAGGKIQAGNPLEPEVRVVSGAAGERVIDGPFVESKEAIGGYFLITAANFEEATLIAQQCPSLRHGLHIEVRRIADACRTLGIRPPAVPTLAHA
jgi:hypothetical protein